MSQYKQKMGFMFLLSRYWSTHTVINLSLHKLEISEKLSLSSSNLLDSRTQTRKDYPQLEKRFDSWLKKQKKTA